MRVAYCRDIAGIGVDAAVESVCRVAAFDLQQDGVVVEEIDFDLSFAREPFLALRGYWMMAHHLHRLDQLDRLGDNVAGNIRLGLDVTTRELAAAERARNRLWLMFHDFFEKYDYLLTPTMAVPPFPVEQNYPGTIAGKKMKTYIDWIAPTFVISMTGLPAGSAPCGLDNRGLPVGMQVIGTQFGEERVLQLMRVIQERNAIGWPERVRAEIE
ncbi:MAG: amidase family protein [candidate division KSB1 bacterium]|nr:amidase family protein [candidate division KSB1 bacterium]